MTEYSTVFTSFSGADVLPLVNGNKIVGEIQSVQWEKSLSFSALERGVKGTIQVTLFNSEYPLMEYKDELFNLLLIYSNEYGQSKAEYIMGIQLQNIKSGVSVDNIVLDATYEFTARDVKLLPNFPFKIEDKVECLHKVAVKQLKEELSREEKVTLDVIQQHFLYQLASGGYTVIRKHELEELKESAKEADSVKIDAEKFAQEIIRQVKKQGCSF